MAVTHPAYQAIVEAALAATDASSGWLLANHDDGLRVMAIGGPSRGSIAVDSTMAVEGARAFALASGQPAALMPQPSDTANRRAGGSAGLPASILALPCGEPEVIGVLEVAGKANGAGFGFRDIEALSGLALVASTLLAHNEQLTVEVAPPEQICAEITALAQRNPARYAKVVSVIEALLSVE